MRMFKLLSAALLILGMSTAVQAQQPGQPDQVAQLTALLDLSDDQQQQLRTLMSEGEAKLGELEQQASAIQQQLREQIGPDYDEGTIRTEAAKLGELTGEMTAESMLMQARIDSVFTAEQREKLEETVRQQQQQMMQMQQQMQQQQQGR